MAQTTKQGKYLANVIRLSATINPKSELELAQKWAKLIAEHGSQSAAIKYLINNSDKN